MSVSIQGLSGVAAEIAASGTQSGAAAAKSAGSAAPFSDLLKDTVSSVNDLQGQAQAAVTGLVTGSGVDVHQAVIATQKASMAFELALAVRSKAVQAYQQVMSMQF